MVEMRKLEQYIEILEDMNEDFTSYREEDFYNKFCEMKLSCNERSYLPYNLYCYILEQNLPMESYYLQALLDVYAFHAVDETFLDILEETLEQGCNDDYINKTHKIIKEYVKDGYITVYRGEFSTEDSSNLSYENSVSYSLDYDTAKHFAVRFKSAMDLTKSVVYTFKVPVEDVVGYIDRESEVICIPISRGGKMELIKEENML